MPKYMVYGREEVFYAKEINADSEEHAIEIFYQTVEPSDIHDGQNCTVEEVQEMKE
jgi:ribosomal protein L20A (L18A)